MVAVEFDLCYYQSEILPLAKMRKKICRLHVKAVGIFIVIYAKKMSFQCGSSKDIGNSFEMNQKYIDRYVVEEQQNALQENSFLQ